MSIAPELMRPEAPSPEGPLSVDDLVSLFSVEEICYMDGWQSDASQRGFLVYCSEGAIPPAFVESDETWVARCSEFAKRTSDVAPAIDAYTQEDPILKMLIANLGSQHRFGATVPEAFRTRENVLACKYIYLELGMWPVDNAKAEAPPANEDTLA